MHFDIFADEQLHNDLRVDDIGQTMHGKCSMAIEKYAKCNLLM